MGYEEDLEKFSKNIDSEIEKLNLKKVNIFNILKSERNEIRHSNFLAWLFDSKESHNLKERIFKCFIEKVINDNKERVKEQIKDISINEIDYTSFKIEREVQNIDLLLISEKEKFVICIENKLDSIEHKVSQTGKMQTDIYIEKINKMDFKEYTKLFIFLTAFNEQPKNEEWIVIDYQIIYDILTQVLRKKNLSSEVKYLIECYMEVLKMNFVEDSEFKKKCQDIYKKYYTSWQIIQRNANTHVESLRDEILKYLKELEGNDKKIEVCYESNKWLCFTTKILKKEFKIEEDEIFFTIGFIKNENTILFLLENKFATIADEDEKERLLSLWCGKTRTKAQKKLCNIKIEDENIEKTAKYIKQKIDFILKNNIEEILKNI